MQTLTFFVLLGGLVLFYFLKIHKKLEWWEGLVLLVVYGVFATTQVILH
jgi:Ca2+/Na+ antiporter